MSSSNEHSVSMEDLTDEPAMRKESKKLRMWWTIVDAKGQSTESIMLDNYAIMQRVDISVRDLWIVIRGNYNYPSTILAREKAILFNIFEELKLIITANEVFILEYSVPGRRLYSDYPARFKESLKSMMSHQETDSDDSNREDDRMFNTLLKAESAFEFRALKLALEFSYNFFYDQTRFIGNSVSLSLGTDSSRMNFSRSVKQDLNEFTDRVQKVSDDIKRLMENKPGLADFCLSRKLAPASSSSGEPMSNPTSHVVDNDVDELRMLLEKHFYQIKSIAEKLCEIKGWVDTKLDRVRNQLIKFELIISSASICLSVFSLVAGILGMNIPFSWNNQKDMFKRVVIVTGTICVILFVIIMSYARYKNLIGNSDQKGWKRFAAEFR